MTKARGACVLAAVTLALSACTAGSGTSPSTGAAASSAVSDAASSEAVASSSPASPSASTLDAPVTIGAFGFTESQILAELYAGVLRKADVDVSITQSTSREVLLPALESGQVEVVPEYLGTLAEFLNVQVNGAGAPSVANNNVERTLDAARALAEPLGIDILDPAPAENVNAFAVAGDFADETGVTTLSDLAGWSQRNDLRLGGPPECPTRPFCQLGLEAAYGMQIAGFTPLDAGGPLTKAALEEGTIDVGVVFSSDGSVQDLDFVVLEDDLGLQNIDNVVPAVLSSIAVPQVVDALNSLSAVLTTEDLIAMNTAVDVDRLSPAEVAAEFLAAKGLG